VHDAGWIHGDIRPSNIVVDSAGNFVLIDWGLADKKGTNTRFRGTLLTVSDDLYDKFEDEGKRYNMEPKHDLEALVKSFYIIAAEMFYLVPPRPETYKQVRNAEEFWKNYAESQLAHYEEAMGFARNCDYENLCYFFTSKFGTKEFWLKKWEWL
jgi:serine/threonine protein kinase